MEVTISPAVDLVCPLDGLRPAEALEDPVVAREDPVVARGAQVVALGDPVVALADFFQVAHCRGKVALEAEAVSQTLAGVLISRRIFPKILLRKVVWKPRFQECLLYLDQRQELPG